jgi:hypothetical protein
MVRRMDDKGGFYHEPPYTEEEELELYRMMSPQPGAKILHGPASPLNRGGAPSRQSPPRQEEK